MAYEVDLTPTWETAVMIYSAVLENPDASPESHETARQELLHLARVVDEWNWWHGGSMSPDSRRVTL